MEYETFFVCNTTQSIRKIKDCLYFPSEVKYPCLYNDGYLMAS